MVDVGQRRNQAVPERAPAARPIRTVSRPTGRPPPRARTRLHPHDSGMTEIEQFFLSSTFFTQKEARIQGWRGAGHAQKLVRSSRLRAAAV
jgi:hypothetical protein